MQDDSTSRRNEGRFFINSRATQITVTPVSDAQQVQSFAGQLADLSLSGVKISIDGKLEMGQEVKLLIQVPSMNFELERRAVARWQQPRDATTWWTGCQLLEPFDATIVEELAAAHVLNRRRDPRYTVDAPAQARWELSDQFVDVKLINFSKGGFCVIFPAPLEGASERLMLQVELNGKESQIPARVMWQGPSPEGFAVGCAFVSIDGFLKLRDYAEPEQLRKKRTFRHRPRRPLSKWVAIALLVLAAIQAIRSFQADEGRIAYLRSVFASWTALEANPDETATETTPTETSSDDATTRSVSVDEPTDLTIPID
ncbi:MAG: PilZ domain-containing protein [Planctomycetales bacterium]|nr:PilZ domain-containing protein [Planctomycetales bacterium]